MHVRNDADSFGLYISSLVVGGIWTSAEIFVMWPKTHHAVSKIQVPLFLWLLGTVAADLLILLYFFAALVGVCHFCQALIADVSVNTFLLIGCMDERHTECLEIPQMCVHLSPFTSFLWSDYLIYREYAVRWRSDAPDRRSDNYVLRASGGLYNSWFHR
jgi:hypothetical protein